jgi:hypothetical protein
MADACSSYGRRLLPVLAASTHIRFRSELKEHPNPKQARVEQLTYPEQCAIYPIPVRWPT